jgi:two-component system sensor histidine kinase RegB
LYFWYHPIPQLQPRAVADSTTLWGRLALDRLAFLLALVTCAAVIVYFVTRVTAELQLRERELREAELQRARTQRLEALGTLAAGAGHELASPLATIAVVTRELERHLEGTNAPQTVLEDVQLIRTELARCRAILNRMSTDAGQVAGDELRRLRLDEVASATLQGLPYRDQIRVELRPDDASQCVFAPRQALAQAIRAVLQNAHDASPPGIPIHFLLSRNGDDVFFEVRDQGAGMPPDVIARAGEPFFTTKEPGQGTGLGLFLTRSVIQRLGGELAFDSRPKQGTAVRISLRRCP